MIQNIIQINLLFITKLGNLILNNLYHILTLSMSLKELPTELLIQIVDNISNDNDLTKLIRCSKTFNLIGTKKLYTNLS